MTVVPLRKPPSKQQAQSLIRELVEKGKVKLHPHCKLRQRQRAITFIQILNCLAKGYVVEAPYQSPSHKGWETAVAGRTAGEMLRVIVCLQWSNNVLVISCYEKKK